METFLKHAGAKLLRSTVKVVLRFEGSPAETEKANPALSLHLERLNTLIKDDNIGKEKDISDPLVQVDVYMPKRSSQDSANTSNAMPVVVNLHGSGFVMDTFGEDAFFCHYIANEVNCIVLDVAYAKAPERPFPEASEDIDDVLAWIWQKDEIEKRLEKYDIAIDSTKVGLTGFSSGGSLALTTCVRAKKHENFNSIKSVVAFYPSTNLAESPYEKPQLKPEKGQGGAIIPPYVRKFLYSCYIPLTQEEPRSSPLISPINATQDCFPHSITLITCEKDSLAREAHQMAEKLQKERIESKGEDDVEIFSEERVINGILLWEAKGQGHNWDKMTKGSAEAAKMRDYAYKLTVNRLKKAFDL